MYDVRNKCGSAIIMVLVLIASAAILYVRKGDALRNPQFYAEDGTIFFLQQYTKGASAIVTPYAGYLHVAPRLIAFVADMMCPYSIIPAVYNYSALLLTLLVVSSVFSPRLSVSYKPLLALAIVLLPEDEGIVFLTFTNIQWILAILLIIVLLKEPPDKQYGSLTVQYISDLAAIFVCGLTGPFSIVLAPFFVWKLIRDRKWSLAPAVVAIVAAAAVQLVFVALEPKQFIRQRATDNFDPRVLTAIFGQKLFGTLFLGDVIPYEISPSILCIAYGIGLVLLLYFSRSTKEFVWTCVGLQLLIAAGCIFRHRADALALVPALKNSQYFYIPHLLLAWSLIGLLAHARAARKLVLYGALTLIFLSSITSHFRSKPFVDYHWKECSELIGERDVHIALNPDPDWWYLDISSRKE
jgi:hypothetical protein